MNIHGRFELGLLSVETLLSLTCKVALKNRNSIELELLTDINMILCNEKSIRVVVPWMIRQYEKANNQYIYDNSIETTHILNLGFNNIYGIWICFTTSASLWKT